MTTSTPRRFAVGAAAAAFAVLAFALATPARAECSPGGIADPVLCPSPSPTPTPSPTSSPTPTQSPTPQPTQSPTPGPQPVFTFPPFPTGIPTALPPGVPGGFGQYPPFPTPSPGPTQPPLEGGQFAAPTGPGLAAQPGGADGGFLARAGLLLLVATGVAGWLWRARVRRWMIGV